MSGPTCGGRRPRLLGESPGTRVTLRNAAKVQTSNELRYQSSGAEPLSGLYQASSDFRPNSLCQSKRATMSNRQTISFLTQRFRDAGIWPDTRHGQNFLIDLNLVRLLVDAASLSRRDVVLEVGTGTGSLTAMLAARAGAVVTVEISGELHQLASEELVDFENVTLLHMDALKNKNRFHPTLLQTIAQQVENVPDGRLKLVANLPYNIATPVISNLLLTDILPGIDDRHDSEGTGRSHYGSAGYQRLRRTECVDSESV